MGRDRQSCRQNFHLPFRSLDSQPYTSWGMLALGWFRPGSLTASAIVLKPSSTRAYVPVCTQDTHLSGCAASIR